MNVASCAFGSCPWVDVRPEASPISPLPSLWSMNVVACLRPSSPGTKQTPASTVRLRGNSCGCPPPPPFVVVVVVVVIVRTASRVGRERERERAREVSHPPPSRVPPGEPPDPSRDEPPLVSEESARRIARHREGASPRSPSDDMRDASRSGRELMVR